MKDNITFKCADCKKVIESGRIMDGGTVCNRCGWQRDLKTLVRDGDSRKVRLYLDLLNGSIHPFSDVGQVDMMLESGSVEVKTKGKNTEYRVWFTVPGDGYWWEGTCVLTPMHCTHGAPEFLEITAARTRRRVKDTV